MAKMIFCKRTDCVNNTMDGMPDWAGENGDCMLSAVMIESSGCQCYKPKETQEENK